MKAGPRAAAKAKGERFFVGKPCARCSSEKRYAVNGDCVSCSASKNKKWMVENKEGRKQYEKQYRFDNAKRIKEWEQTEQGKVVRKRISQKSVAKGKSSWTAMMSRMRAWNRIAKWDDELTDFACREAHELARMRDRCTGVKWSVDHIVPLKGKRVSGLHTWNNLQVILLQNNRLKSAKFEV
jgi:hypothetical protein